MTDKSASSCLERAQSHSVMDVTLSLIKLGRVEEALEYLINVLAISDVEQTDDLSVLNMSVDEYIAYMYPKPLPVVKGRWDNVIYGEAAYR